MASSVVVDLHSELLAQIFAGEVLALVLLANDADGGAKESDQALKFCLRLVRDDLRNVSYCAELDVPLGQILHRL